MQATINCSGRYNKGWLVAMVFNQNRKELKDTRGTVKVRSGHNEGHTGGNGIGSPTRKGLQIF